MRSTFAEIEQSKLSKTQMSAAAAAAALARQDANKLSVGELKKKFQDRNIDTSACIEKSDLVALYVRTIGKEEHMKDVKNRPTRPKPQKLRGHLLLLLIICVKAIIREECTLVAQKVLTCQNQLGRI